MHVHLTCRTIKIFQYGSAICLAVPAMLKILTIGTGAAFLADKNPVFGVSEGAVFGVVSLLEGCIALFLLLGEKTRKLGLTLLWIGLNFLLYRLAFHFITPGGVCGCAGKLGIFAFIPMQFVSALFLLLAVFVTTSGLLLTIHDGKDEC